jgi:hypothetical protein
MTQITIGKTKQGEDIIIEGYETLESFTNDLQTWNILAELADKHFSTEDTDGRFTDEGIQFMRVAQGLCEDIKCEDCSNCETT